MTNRDSFRDSIRSDHGPDHRLSLPPLYAQPSPPPSLHRKESYNLTPIGDVFPETEIQKEPPRPSTRRQNAFMVFITLTQLVQMIPLGAGINSSLAIGAALNSTPIQSVWIAASYPLTQGSFVLIGKKAPLGGNLASGEVVE